MSSTFRAWQQFETLGEWGQSDEISAWSHADDLAAGRYTYGLDAASYIAEQAVCMLEMPDDLLEWGPDDGKPDSI